jgi:hypothetical protein
MAGWVLADRASEVAWRPRWRSSGRGRRRSLSTWRRATRWWRRCRSARGVIGVRGDGVATGAGCGIRPISVACVGEVSYRGSRAAPAAPLDNLRLWDVYQHPAPNSTLTFAPYRFTPRIRTLRPVARAGLCLRSGGVDCQCERKSPLTRHSLASSPGPPERRVPQFGTHRCYGALVFGLPRWC